MSIEDLPEVKTKGESQAPDAMIAFSKKDAVGIHLHNDDPIVITIKYDEYEIKIIPID